MARRFLRVGRDPGTERLVRCRCVDCGSHALCVQLKSTLSGQCPTCGGYELAPLRGGIRVRAVRVARKS